MKIKDFVKISAFAILAFSMLGCGKEKIEDKEITVAGIEMVRIPDSAEHKGLYFGKYEVTQEQWQEIMGNNPSYFKGDLSRPVEMVSWNDCQDFIKKLNARTEVKSAGITFRLPTEEEWEYACRAGSKGKYGLLADGREGTIDEMGWYEDNDDKIHPVGQKKPNAWGLYDMHGNVWEWTASADGSSRIFRGGSYCNDASDCESDYRDWNSPDLRHYGLGFRLVASRTGK
ncbi:MAG: formylglycine-generating enzyme family protein [Kiritimatiellae bacterium]|nr:formylglycine-generating enzyme family protein [Kiritimatiellia bacterium]